MQAHGQRQASSQLKTTLIDKRLMQIRYSLTRGDMRRAVSSAWSQSPRFRLLLSLFGAWPSALHLIVRLATTGSVQTLDFVAAAVLLLVFGSLLPLLLIVRTKTCERVLSIDHDGIKTTIGQMHGEIPWSKVGGIEAGGGQILIIGTTPNLFAVPFRAFEQAEDRMKFVDTAREYWKKARAQAAV